jgi:hypothetical protein
VINNVAHETYHPEGCYVENVFGRQRESLALQPEFTLDWCSLAYLSGAVEWVVRIHSCKNEPKVKFVKII